MVRTATALLLFCLAGIPALGDETAEAEKDRATKDDGAVLLFPIVKDGKWGYMNETGEVVIEPQYDCAWDFSEGLACVQKGWFRGYIDPAGKIVIDPQFGWAGGFSSGMAPVFIEAKAWGGAIQFYLATRKKRWTFINRKGEVQRVADWRLLPDFHEGKLCHGKNCLGTNGKRIEHDADELRRFSDGLAAARKGGKWGYLDHDMKWVIEPAFDAAGEFSEGLAPVGKAEKQEGDEKKTKKRRRKRSRKFKWGYADRTGKLAIEYRFDEAKPFSEGLAGIRAEGLWGFVDTKGEVVVERRYAYVWPFSEGLARVWTGTKDGEVKMWTPEKQGYINTKGEMAVEPAFDIGWEFSNGLARVSVGGKEGYIDKKGKYVWEPTE
jgi:hypothetical protein